MAQDDQNEEGTASRPTWAVVCAVAGFWIGVGVLSGTAEFMSLRIQSPQVTWLEAVRGPLVAGLIWIPLTLAIGTASLRFPPITLGPRFQLRTKPALVHGLTSLSTTFVLNAIFIAIDTPSYLVQPGPFARAFLATGLSFLHFNFGGYWAIALGVIAIQFIRNRQQLGEPPPPRAADLTLTVRSGTRTVLVRIDEIRWIEGADDYVRLHVSEGNHLYSERLKRLEKRLDPTRFVRVHRSAIVNVSAVRSLRHLGHGDYEAEMDQGDTVRVSRTRRARLTALLESREVPDLPLAGT